jgi:hypothetical protein
MKDADWEVGNCLRLLADENRLGKLPPALADLAASQGDLLRQIARDNGNVPLPCYSVTAR